MIEKLLKALRWLGPILAVYPPWAKALFVLTGVLIVTSLLVFALRLAGAMEGLDQSGRPRLSAMPYPSFSQDFPEVVAPYVVPETGSLVHVVWGDLGKIQNTTVVLPLNQAFDFDQRGPRGTLAAFESHKIGNSAFYDYLDEQWPRSQRPSTAGLGRTKLLSFENESHGLHGVLLVVSTRNLSENKSDYGRYKSTPIEGIDLILDQVFREARIQKLDSLALPLIGAGYATIQSTHDDPELKVLVQQSILLLSLGQMIKALADASSPLRRGILVLYPSDSAHQHEDDQWKLVQKFLAGNVSRRDEIIREMLDEFDKREKHSAIQTGGRHRAPTQRSDQ